MKLIIQIVIIFLSQTLNLKKTPLKRVINSKCIIVNTNKSLIFVTNS